MGRAAITGSWLTAALVGGMVGYSVYAARRAERLVPRDGSILDVADARLHYVDIGSGRPVVLVHGLGGQLRNFTYALTERLARDYRVIAVDRPGSGYSVYTGRGDHGLQAQVKILGSFIAALDLERPLLVGHSLGGAVALALATKYPRMLGGLALIAPLSQPIDEAPALFKPLSIRSKVMRAAIAWAIAAPLAKIRRRQSLEAVFSPEPAPVDFIGRGGGALGSRPGSFYAASTEIASIGAEIVTISKRYNSIDLPVAILFGKEDQILDPVFHGERTAASIPAGEFTLVSGGHMLPVTAPDTTARWFTSWAKRVDV